MRTITTNQAPSAKPDAISKAVPVDWIEVADGPSYDVEKVGFSSERRIAPGVAEISSPLLITNISGETARIDARIERENGDVSEIAVGFPVPVADALMLPVQGQFLLAGDTLKIRADVEGALFATMSFTEGQAEEDGIDVN